MDTNASNISGEHAIINCPKCGQQIVYYDVENSSCYVCSSCLSYFEHEHEKNPWVITRFQHNTLIYQSIPIGAEGTFDGVSWKVTGFMVKSEQGENVRWREYLLYRKGEPYRTLAEYNGHWMLIDKAPEKRYESKKRGYKDYFVDTSDNTYDLYHSYKYEIIAARGEFDWNIMNDADNMIVFEYIAPPYILIQEELDNKSEWYKGKYKEPHEVAMAFGMKVRDLPRKSGVGAIQPTTFYDKFPVLMKAAVMFSVLIIATQIYFSYTRPEKTLLDMPILFEREPITPTITPVVVPAITPADIINTTQTEISLNGLDKNIKPIVTPSFTVHGPAMLTIQVSADVDNNWVEYPMTLVDEKTGTSYELTRVVEYYHGYDGGESWSEGGQVSEAELNNIPAGTYHLNIYPYADNTNIMSGSVVVKEHETLYSNVFLIMMVVVAYPILMIWRKKSIENSRWGYE